MKYVWITILVSVFISMSVLIPIYVEKISVSQPVSAEVETIDSDEIPYPAPTEIVIPTQMPYPEPPRPTPYCYEYWFEGVFQGFVCVQP